MDKKKNLTTKETFALAVQNHQKNNLKIAENLYKEALRTNPNHFESVFYLGSLFVQIKKFKSAIPLFHEAIKINPDHADSHNNLGVVFKELKEFKNAMHCYEKAIQIQPNHVDAHNNLGAIFKQLGEHKKAITYFQKTNSTFSREELLKYSYSLDGLEVYKIKLEKFTQEETCSRKIAAMAAYVSKKENIINSYPFCKDPLNFVFIKNLKNTLTSIDNFSENLLLKIKKIHAIWEPKATTTRGGYQTLNNLFDSSDLEIVKLKEVIEKHIIIYRKIHENSEDYFIKKWPQKCKFNAWYVKLLEQGHQNSHMHARGWLSGVFYVKVPKFSNNNEGSINFLLSGYDLPDDKNLPSLKHSPNDFDLVLFPSSLFHKTIPFNSRDGRHSIAFDLMPK